MEVDPSPETKRQLINGETIKRIGGVHKAFKSLKRKLEDPTNIEVIVLDPLYDATLIDKIPFPADSCNAFHLLLKITHLMYDDLPKTLTKTEVVDLAALYEKYHLNNTVLTIVNSMNWLRQHRGSGTYWPSNTICQKWALATYQLKRTAESTYLVSILAMNVAVDEKDGTEYYMRNETKVPLHRFLPDAILGTIRRTRSAALQEILSACNTSIELAVHQEVCEFDQSIECAAIELGSLIKVLYPLPDNATMMYGSVCTYWEGFKEMCEKKRDDRIKCSPHSRTSSTSSIPRCRGGIGVVSMVRDTLETHVNDGLWAQWKKHGYTDIPI
ncbi:Nn.00g093520.m01.CDS01 [Neocucurbitaria sp. VM-36]